MFNKNPLFARNYEIGHFFVQFVYFAPQKGLFQKKKLEGWYTYKPKKLC